MLDDDGSGHPTLRPDTTPVPHPFRTAGELLAACEREGLSIADVMLANEAARSSEAEVRAGLLHLWEVMVACVAQGTTTPGVLPGGLKVRRRAADLRASLDGRHDVDAGRDGARRGQPGRPARRPWTG